VAATVEVEVADSEEEDREDIKLLPLHFCLRYTIYINYSGGLLAKRRSWITPLPRKGVNMNIYVGNLSLEVAEGGTATRIHGFRRSAICNSYER